MKRDLHLEAVAVLQLMTAYKEQLGDDDKAIADMVDGETAFHEVCDVVLQRIADLEDSMEAIVIQGRKLNARNSRYKAQHEGLRKALLSALETAQMTRVERPIATVALTKTGRTALIKDAAKIPADFKTPQPDKIDMRALAAALKAGPVDGAELSNGGTTVNISRS